MDLLIEKGTRSCNDKELVEILKGYYASLEVNKMPEYMMPIYENGNFEFRINPFIIGDRELGFSLVFSTIDDIDGESGECFIEEDKLDKLIKFLQARKDELSKLNMLCALVLKKSE